MTTHNSIAEVSAPRSLLVEGVGSNPAALPPLLPTLAEITEIEHQRAVLAERRDSLLQQLLSDLEWMDTPVHSLGPLGISDLPESIQAGTRVHIVRQYEEAGSYDRLFAHPTDVPCDWYCRGVAGGIVKGGGPSRWRFRCEGECEYLGSMTRDGETEYLFKGAQ